MFHPGRKLALPIFATLLPVLAACSSQTADQPAAGGAPGGDTAVQTAAPSAPPAAQRASRDRDMTAAELVQFAQNAIVRIETQGGVGSGVIVGADGYIVTNNHVVAGIGGRPSGSLRVTLSDGSELAGQVVGTDPRADLAVVKIQASGLTALKLARLSEVEVGQDVVAIGYALDLRGGEGASFSVTRGIVSAKNRGIDEASTILGAIQTDAAINHGNSGGPLLNMRGEVVGINTALAPDRTTGGVAAGIGFAVGSDTVAAVYESIRESGRVSRGLLGVLNFEALRPADARRLGLAENVAGVFLDSDDDLAANGPAAQAGLRGGDVIVRIDGAQINTEADLAVAMIRHHPGERVVVEIFRDGKRLTLQVTLGTPAQ